MAKQNKLKHKNLRQLLIVCLILIAASFLSAAPVRLAKVSADPVPTCGSGATLVPASGNNAAYCSCPTGQVLVTGNPNTCESSCPAGATTGTDTNGQTFCNPASATPTTTAGTCVTGQEPTCAACPTDQTTSPALTTCSDPAATECSTLSQADQKPGVNCVTGCNQNGCDLIGKYANGLISLLSALVGIVVVISLILGGIQYSASGGDPQKAAAAKSRISKTIIALVAFALVYAFLQFIVPGGVFKQ